jgi:hypothetical protein
MGRPLVDSEAVLYGTFIETAYAMFDDNSADLTPPVPAPTSPSSMPTGWEMTAWIQMSDFAFGGGEYKKFYGFLARNAADPYSHIIAIRGTEGAIEWYDDAVCLPRAFTPVPNAGDVASGFDAIYLTLQVVRCPREAEPGSMSALDAAKPQAMAGTFADQVEALLGTLPISAERRAVAGPNAKHSFVVTGHSLGGALVTLYTMEHAIKKRADPSRKVVLDVVCTFASPRVGMEAFVQAFDALPIDSWRIANSQDIVPKVPPSIPLLLPYQHVDTLYGFSSAGMVAFNPSCWHSMRTYLHWLEPTQALDAACRLAK